MFVKLVINFILLILAFKKYKILLLFILLLGAVDDVNELSLEGSTTD